MNGNMKVKEDDNEIVSNTSKAPTSTKTTTEIIFNKKTTVSGFLNNLDNPIDKFILGGSIVGVMFILALVTAIIVCLTTEAQKRSHRKNRKKELAKRKKKQSATSSTTSKKQVSETESTD